MSMTKKHYVAIAETLRDAPIDSAARAHVALALIKVFQADNPSFDPTRFAAAVLPAYERRTHHHVDVLA